MEPYQVSLQQQIQFYSKLFGNKHCRYNEGPLYISQSIVSRYDLHYN